MSGASNNASTWDSDSTLGSDRPMRGAFNSTMGSVAIRDSLSKN